MKRFLAFLCTVAMLLSLPIVLPLSVDAAWTPEGGLAFAANGTDNYQLTNKITRGELVTIEMTFKLPADTDAGLRRALMSDFNADKVEGFFLEKGEATTYGRTGSIHFYGWKKNDAGTIDRYEFWVEGNVCTGDWVHFALVLDEDIGSSKAYINGVQKNLINNKGEALTSANVKSKSNQTITEGKSPEYLRLGRINSNDSHESNENGTTVIKNVAIYKDVRTADEIKKDVKTIDRKDENLLVAYDLSCGTYWYDLSGNGNHLTARAHADGTPAANAVAEGAVFPVNTNFRLSELVADELKTVEMWVKIPTDMEGTRQALIGDLNSDNYAGFYISKNTSGYPHLYWRYEDANGKIQRYEVWWTQDIATGEWVHLAFVLHPTDYTQVKGYINGEYVAPGGATPGTASEKTKSGENLLPISLGKWTGGADTHAAIKNNKAIIKEVAMFSDEREASEVAADYANGLTLSDDALLVAYDLDNTALYHDDGVSTAYWEDLSSNNNHLKVFYDRGMEGGLVFTGKEDAVMSNTFEDTAPYTFEAEIFVPVTMSGRAGIIMANFMDQGDTCFSFEINTNGAPRFYFSHAKNTSAGAISVTDITFTEVDVRTGNWAHVAVVFDEANDALLCYLNGELAQTKSCTEYYYEGTFDWAMMIGSDYRAGNAQYFKGNIKSAAVYSDVRSADEIKADFEATTLATTDEACLGAWEFEADQAHGVVYQDLGPANNDVTYTDYWFDKTEAEEASDYAYSFVLVGDTQGINDTSDGTKMEKLYDWIVANKTAKNIQYVIGLGDITEHPAQSHANHTNEWEHAVESIGKLDAAGIPHIQVRGNHDNPASFNQYFGVGTTYGDTLEGTYNGTAANSYKRFTIGNTKWLLMTLDNGAADGVIEWAGEIIDRYSDHKVIVSTHAYIYGNGEYHTDRYQYSPSTQTVHPTDPSNTKVTGGHNGDELWAKLISQHENITLMLCGHNYGNVIPVRQDMGVHGNIVTQVLIDFQYVDQKEEDAGIVTMFYFSPDGSTVEVETYSTLKEKYYRAANQFTFSLTGEENPGRESDSYGWLQEGTDYCFEILDLSGKGAATRVNGVRYKSLADVDAALATLNKDGLVVKMLGNVRSNITAEFKWTTTADFTIDGGGWIYDTCSRTSGYVWNFATKGMTVTIRNLTMVSIGGCIATNGILNLESGVHLYGGYSYGFKNENYYVADFGTDTDSDGVKDTFVIPGTDGQAYAAHTTLRPAGSSTVTIAKGVSIYAAGGPTGQSAFAIYADSNSTVTINGGYFESHMKDYGTVGTQPSNNNNKTLTINGGTFVNRFFDANGNVGYAVLNGRGTTEINGGTFIAYGGAPIASWNKSGATSNAPQTVINGGTFISKAPVEGGVELTMGAKGNAPIVIDDTAGYSKVTVNGGLFINERAQTTELCYSTGNNTFTLSGGRFLSLATASDNLALTEAQKAADVKIEGQKYYVVSEQLGTANENAPVLVNGAQVRLATNTGIRFGSTVKKIDGATYGTIIVPTDYVIKALALKGGITEENLIKVSAHGKIAKIIATEKGMTDNGDGTVTIRAALTDLANFKDTSFTAIAFTEVDGETYYSLTKLADNSRTISEVASAALADVSAVQGGKDSHGNVCNEAHIFNDESVVAYHRYGTETQQILAGLMTEADLAACKAAVAAKLGA